MNVIIDTNVIVRDLKLKDKKFEILKDYLKKTNSRLLIPSIVLEETLGFYERMLKERTQDYYRIHKKMSNILMSSNMENLSQIDFAKETKLYENFLRLKLEIQENSIIKYKNEYLPELVKRAIKRKKPLDIKGQQFRDGLLWLTILDVAKSLENRSLIFISDNVSDFGNKKTNSLNNELEVEIENLNIKIIYFRTIDDFTREYAQKINAISTKWINENVNIKELNLNFHSVLKTEYNYFLMSYKDSLESNERLTGYIKETGQETSRILDYYVYQMTDGIIYVNLNLSVTKEFEVEVERNTEGWKYDFGYDHIEGEFGYHYKFGFEEEVYIDSIEFNFVVKFVLTVENEKIINYELIGWDWE